MTGTKGKVIHLYQRDPKEALERLNRITGLRFSSWPQSLLQGDTAVDKPVEMSVSVQSEQEPTTGPVERVSG